MLDYSLSTHPVWNILDLWGLPPEIINIIFNYYRMFTPVNNTFIEYTDIIKTITYSHLSKTFCYNDIFETFQNIIFKNTNNISKKFLSNFIKKYMNTYANHEIEIYNKFVTYYTRIYSGSSNIAKIRLVRKIRSFDSSTIPSTLFNLILNLLKNLLTISFHNKIYKIINSKDIDDYFQVDTYDYKFDKFNIDKLWNNIKYIILLRSDKCIDTYFRIHNISKSELLMFNFILGLSYKKSWTKERLIRNIYMNEFVEYNQLLNYFSNDNNSIYTLPKLNNIMKHTPFSSVDNINNEMIIHDTLNVYHKLIEY